MYLCECGDSIPEKQKVPRGSQVELHGFLQDAQECREGLLQVWYGKPV